MEKCELGSRLESDPSFALLSFSSLSSRRCGCKQVFLQCWGLNKSDLTHSKTTQLCIVRSLSLIRCPTEEYMSWLMIALASLYTVYKSWSHCIIQPERGGNSGVVTKVIKFTFPHTQTQVAFVQTLEGKKSVCVCVMGFDRLCCRLQVYIGRIRGPSNTTANCYCPHLVKDIVEHIMVFLHIRKDFLTLSIHQKSSRFLPLSTYLHVHTVFLIPLCRTSPKIAVLLISCKERGKKSVY